MSVPLIPGGKFYFPNIVMKLCRSNLPPHQAVFYCPPQLNKFDIQQYLTKLYDIEITDVRTMNYLGKAGKTTGPRVKNAIPSYKKVIVTMKEDFIFPPPPTVQDSKAIKLPPQTSFGRNSANKLRSKINEQAKERGTLEEQQ